MSVIYSKALLLLMYVNLLPITDGAHIYPWFWVYLAKKDMGPSKNEQKHLLLRPNKAAKSILLSFFISCFYTCTKHYILSKYE